MIDTQFGLDRFPIIQVVSTHLIGSLSSSNISQAFNKSSGDISLI
jgi:hypothetical protein